MIILNDADVERVRGPSEIDPLSALDPVPVPGGLWMLPLAVLADPAHERFRDFLQGLPQEDIPSPADRSAQGQTTRSGWHGRR
jgi:hypothetical protein